jgi:hypothetical protein
VHRPRGLRVVEPRELRRQLEARARVGPRIEGHRDDELEEDSSHIARCLAALGGPTLRARELHAAPRCAVRSPLFSQAMLGWRRQKRCVSNDRRDQPKMDTNASGVRLGGSTMGLLP